MKKLLYLIPLFLGLALTSCYKDDIRDLQNQINKIKGTQIASLQKQIDAIKTTLPKLEQTDKELNDYIAALQTTATNLQSSINETNAKIEEVKSSLHSDISATKTEILAELSAMQNEMDGELKKINNTIQTLQAMDGALDTKIEDLKRYVDTELANTQDWANATFATLEQYSEVASDIATIKQSIITLNKNLEAFEQRVSETIVTEITKALESIKDELIAEVISEIADTYMSAISNATEEVTEAYNRAISTAIATLEESMMSWVSDQLKGYYTIAEVEGKLAAIENTISNNDMVLAAEIDALYKSLAESKAETTAEYEKAIADAIKTNDGVIDGKIAVAIAEVNIRIENEIKAINTKIEDIESRLEKVEGDIATIGEQIDNINNTIITLQDADAQLSVYIDELQTTATNLQNAIDETNVLIDNLTNEMGNEILNAKADVLEQLARLRDEMMCELEQIHKTILTLQDKDEELDQKIALLQDYVLVELANNKDWANATFATLEQYASISSELSVIQAEITYITQNITSLEKRINDKIEYEVTVAISALDSSIQDRVQAITTAYSAAISAAREEITAAYTAEIQNAFAALEYKMKNWVNEQLQEYYTIYEVDGMLAVLRNEVTNSDNAILAEIEALEEALAKSKDELINVYSEIVKRAINENNGVIDDMIAGAIAQATARIDNDIKTIISNIASIESRLNKVEGDIANINGQIANINNTIQSLQNAHDELEAYVGYLQSVASNLQESIGSINGRIDEVETAMQDELSTAKAEIIAQLSSLKRDVEDELSQINEAIVILQAKDAQLDNKITTLQSYVDTELANNKDWANATFATLEQQNALAGEVATIKAQITTINQSISDLENRISAKISRDIADAAATLNTTIQDKISEVTSAYTAAISKAKSDITAAYTAEIQNAFSALEYTMKRWVNEQLAGYYTIAEVDALLAAMQNEFNGQLASQRAYLEGLISTLSNELTSQIAANSSLISSLRNSIDEIQNTTSASYATKIAENADAIAKNAQSIIDNAAAIASNKSDIETNAALIAQNKSATETNSALIAQNKSAIEGMQITTNAAITKCAADITTNAENIAKNAALIAQNATAINNNSQAIANNAADILQLQRDLAKAKDDITAAYNVAISTAINTLNGELRGEIASQIATINSRINTEVATINSAIETLSNRVTALEGEVDAIQQQIADILTDIAEIKQDIENLMKRIQSVTYIPKYSDGKATMDYRTKIAELDFLVSPKSAVTELEKVWDKALSLKAIYTITRAVEFIDVPIVEFVADSNNGVITIKASGVNLSEDFYTGQSDAKAILQISDGNSWLSSDYITMTPNYNIQFKDLGVMAICCKNWDTNHDSELSYEEAAAVETIGTVFKENDDIIHFTELKYFTGISEIPAEAFSQCTSLWEITLPDNITSIGSSAFSKCSSLESIAIPNSTISIGTDAFNECTYLQSVNISDLSKWCKLRFASSRANPLYYGSKLYLNNKVISELTSPSDITEIKDYAFYNCSSLKSITISNNVTSIGKSAFNGCSNIESIYIPNSVTTIAESAFCYCTGELIIDSNAIVGTNYPSNNYPSYYGGWLSGSDFTILTIGNSVTAIGSCAFKGCSSLKSVTIGNNVTQIRDSAFSKCDNVTCMYFYPTTPPAIYYNVYSVSPSFPQNAELKIYVPRDSYDNYKQYSSYSNDKVSQTNWYMYKSYIEPYDSSGPLNNQIWYTSCDGNIVNIDNISAFDASIISNHYENSVGKITFSENITTIGDCAFLDCTNLTSIIIPDSVTIIGYGAFAECTNLTSITIPDSVTTIGKMAFFGCSNTTSVVIPSSVTSIGLQAFESCTGELIINCNIPASTPIDRVRPFGHTEFTSITIGDDVSTIGSCAFYNIESITKLTIGKNVANIEGAAFGGCSGITSITIPDSVTLMGYGVFYDCDNLTEVYCKALTPPTVDKGDGEVWNGFTNTAENSKIYVPAESVNLYKTADGWNEFADKIVGYDFVAGKPAA